MSVSALGISANIKLLFKMDVDWSSTTNCLTHSSQNTMQIYHNAPARSLSLPSHHRNILLCETIDFMKCSSLPFQYYLLAFICMLLYNTHNIVATYSTSFHQHSFHICVCASLLACALIQFIIFYGSSNSNEKNNPHCYFNIYSKRENPRYSHSQVKHVSVIVVMAALLLLLLQC